MSPITNVQTPTTPMKSNQNSPQIPKTPSLVAHDNFDQTPTSFADSGFFSAADNGTPNGAGYKDWILFPENEDVESGKGGEFLDTTGFFKDADEIMTDNYSEEEGTEISPESSLEVPPLNPSHSFQDFHIQDLVHALDGHSISSPLPPPTPRLKYADLATVSGDGNVSMFELWEQSKERHESIAYQLEQPPYTLRDHLLPGLKQQQTRVKRRGGNGIARSTERSTASRRGSVRI